MRDVLLSEARALVERPEARTAGWWALGAVLLARQALERRLADLVAKGGGRPEEAPFSAQLLVLPQLCGDAELAGRVAWVWGRLSEAAHVRGLPPTGEEVRGWIGVIEAFVEVEG